MSEFSKEIERSMKEDTPEEKKVSESDTSKALPLEQSWTRKQKSFGA